jgi:hypothetical protein
MKPSILLVLLAFYALHQDFWNWNSARPLLFGFLPIGLAYHALYTLAATGLMTLLVRWAWPHRLETWAGKEPEN